MKQVTSFFYLSKYKFSKFGEAYISNTDYVYVRIQTFDKFHSKWEKYSFYQGINELIHDPFKFICSPNPCSNQANLSFVLPTSSNMSIIIYSTTGMMVQSLVDKDLLKGKHIIQFNGSSLPAGIYYCRLDTEYGSDVIKLIIQK